MLNNIIWGPLYAKRCPDILNALFRNFTIWNGDRYLHFTDKKSNSQIGYLFRIVKWKSNLASNLTTDFQLVKTNRRFKFCSLSSSHTGPLEGTLDTGHSSGTFSQLPACACRLLSNCKYKHSLRLFQSLEPTALLHPLSLGHSSLKVFPRFAPCINLG